MRPIQPRQHASSRPVRGPAGRPGRGAAEVARPGADLLSHAAALRQQALAGNRAVARRLASSGLMSTTPGHVVQRTWMFLADLGRGDTTRDTYYWDPGPEKAAEPRVAPGAARRFGLSSAKPDNSLPAVRDTANSRRRGTRALTEQEYLTLRAGGTPSRGKRNTYNPFGRFSTQLTRTAYIPFGTPPEKYALLGITLHPSLGHLAAEHAPIIEADLKDPVPTGNYLYPRRVQVGTGEATHPGQAAPSVWLDLVALDPLGATYGDGPPLTGARTAVQGRATAHVPALQEVAAELARHRGSAAVTSVIDIDVIRAFQGSRTTEDSQKTVMGVSAGDMARAAGFDDAVDPEFAADTTVSGRKKHGWEWLHLISYALGGPTESGPQHAANLVVGTTAANTAMIMVEDAINAVLTDPGSPVRSATVVVLPLMAEPSYLVAQTITYQLTFTLKNGRTLPEFTVSFSALSTATPYEATNKYFRALFRASLAQEAARQPFARGAMYG